VKPPSEAGALAAARQTADTAADKAVEALRRMISDPRTGPMLRARLERALVRHGRRAA
jgi:hypothetical protein